MCTHNISFYGEIRKNLYLMSSFLDLYIRKTYQYNIDLLKPHFYIVKLGFRGVDIIFLTSAQNIDCVLSLERPCQSSSNASPKSMF